MAPAWEVEFSPAPAFAAYSRVTSNGIDAAAVGAATDGNLGGQQATIASPTVRALSGALPPTMPSADFCAAVRPPYDNLSLKKSRRSAGLPRSERRLNRAHFQFILHAARIRGRQIDPKELRPHLCSG
jgi:hypothetical protein